MAKQTSREKVQAAFLENRAWVRALYKKRGLIDANDMARITTQESIFEVAASLTVAEMVAEQQD